MAGGLVSQEIGWFEIQAIGFIVSHPSIEKSKDGAPSVIDG
jgi:hypothetical protein